MSWLIEHAAFMSGTLGLLSAFILAWPLFDEIRDRKLWDLLSDFKTKVANARDEQEALKSIRERLLDSRLGRYRKARLFTFGGLMVLGAAFVFLIIDAVTRGS